MYAVFSRGIQRLHINSYEDCIVSYVASCFKCIQRYKLRATKAKTLDLVWSFKVIAVSVTRQPPNLILPHTEFIILINKNKVHSLLKWPREYGIIFSFHYDNIERKMSSLSMPKTIQESFSSQLITILSSVKRWTTKFLFFLLGCRLMKQLRVVGDLVYKRLYGVCPNYMLELLKRHTFQ